MKIMKTLLLSFMILVLSMDLYAQRHFDNRKVSIYNNLNKYQLNLALEKSQNMVGNGLFLIFLGLTISFTEFAVDIANPENNKNFYGKYIMAAGAGITIAGIPIVINGVRKKNEIKSVIIKYELKYSINKVGLKVRF
jgi:hypothetical protein